MVYLRKKCLLKSVLHPHRIAHPLVSKRLSKRIFSINHRKDSIACSETSSRSSLAESLLPKESSSEGIEIFRCRNRTFPLSATRCSTEANFQHTSEERSFFE
ncbi:hypothetical protein KIN20_016384 [Parelaphostrongylus tenuis]|uniref:Uncharacterized protein n=1 Tax=Parelaphostrongylus tenuis TaxID=148309 RepID=A0AAD5QQN7_PARTN|nr:hypothetical protein KIN20_016384 [Parelaphostrongylus tenuis]